MIDYIDGQGIAFSLYRDLLPRLAAEFPNANPVLDVELREQYRQQWQWCQLCGKPLRQWGVDAHLHHIFGGQIKSDEPTNFFACCNTFEGCHQAVQSQRDWLPCVLAAKVETDQDSTDWVRLAILYGQFLPEPILSKYYSQCYFETWQRPKIYGIDT